MQQPMLGHKIETLALVSRLSVQPSLGAGKLEHGRPISASMPSALEALVASRSAPDLANPPAQLKNRAEKRRCETIGLLPPSPSSEGGDNATDGDLDELDSLICRFNLERHISANHLLRQMDAVLAEELRLDPRQRNRPLLARIKDCGGARVRPNCTKGAIRGSAGRLWVPRGSSGQRKTERIRDAAECWGSAVTLSLGARLSSPNHRRRRRQRVVASARKHVSIYPGEHGAWPRRGAKWVCKWANIFLALTTIGVPA